MASFIFVRHGESEANAALIIADDTPQLTEKGRAQALVTAAEVRQFDIKAVACSPLIRAQQTAEIIAGELGIDVAHIEVIEELRERYMGELQGKPKEHDSEWYVKARDGYGMETQQEVITRMRACLDRIRTLAEAQGTILVVGHGAAGYYLLEVAKGYTHYEDFEPFRRIENAEFTKVDL
jgi:probable phosphoglycerate mutase